MKYKCHEKGCGHLFFFVQCLKDHLRLTHRKHWSKFDESQYTINRSVQKMLTSTTSTRKFDLENQLECHERNHGYVCLMEGCGNVFINYSAFQRHSRTCKQRIRNNGGNVQIVDRACTQDSSKKQSSESVSHAHSVRKPARSTSNTTCEENSSGHGNNEHDKTPEPKWMKRFPQRCELCRRVFIKKETRLSCSTLRWSTNVQTKSVEMNF